MAELSTNVETAEATDIFGVAQKTLPRRAAERTIVVHRYPANGYRLFKLSDVETFLQQVKAIGSNKPKREK